MFGNATISLDEAKASIRKIRAVGKTVSNNSILSEIHDRSLFTPPDKKTRKERHKEEQAELPLLANSPQTPLTRQQKPLTRELPHEQ
jgi:putative transposase